jgi:hypothetical protein
MELDQEKTCDYCTIISRRYHKQTRQIDLRRVQAGKNYPENGLVIMGIDFKSSPNSWEMSGNERQDDEPKYVQPRSSEASFMNNLFWF